MALLGQSRRELTIYDTSRPREKFANENAMTLLGQSRDSWPFMAPRGHVEFGKTGKTLRKEKQKPKQKWKTKWKQKR